MKYPNTIKCASQLTLVRASDDLVHFLLSFSLNDTTITLSITVATCVEDSGSISRPSQTQYIITSILEKKNFR